MSHITINFFYIYLKVFQVFIFDWEKILVKSYVHYSGPQASMAIL